MNLLIEGVKKVYSLCSNKAVVFVLIAGLCSLGSVIVFFNFKVVTDMYGDGRTLIKHLTERTFIFSDVFDWKNTEPLSFLLYQTASSLLHLELKEVIQLVSSVIGGVFVFSILIFIFVTGANTYWKILFCVALLTAGSNQLFFGYVENYTPAYLFISIFLMLSWMYFEGKKTLGWMILVFVIGTRFHIQCILLLPSLVYAIVFSFREKSSFAKRLLKPKTIFALFVASVLGGTLLYFFYFHANELLTITREEAAQKIFLPITNNLSYPHYYTIFSLNHFSDILQEIFFTISPAAIILLSLGIFRIHSLNLKDARFVFYGIGVFYFALFNFTVNPLLSPPRDWDMLSLAAMPISFLALSISKQLFEKIDTSIQKNIIRLGISLAIFSCSIFWVNADVGKVNERLINVGKWVYKSYYTGSAYIINAGVKTISDTHQRIEKYKSVLFQLNESRSSPDDEISAVYEQLGAIYSDIGEPIKSMQIYSLSADHGKTNLNFKLQRYEECIKEIEDSLKINPQNAYLIGLRGSALIQLNRIDVAEEYLKEALAIDSRLGFAYLDLSIIYSFRSEPQKVKDILTQYYDILPPESNEAKLIESILKQFQ
jgi:hypothetical protein